MIVLMMLFGELSYRYSIVHNKSTVSFTISTVLFLLIFAFFVGVRFNVGVDYPAYLQNYKYALNEMHFKFDFTVKEPLFNFFTQFFAVNKLSPVVYFATIGFIQILFIFLAFKKQQYLLP
ncbi:MAG: EpsG family protein, partial [Firmicutes bacterium]|nr:EpsG family protein [Bacillota bacterium]